MVNHFFHALNFKPPGDVGDTRALASSQQDSNSSTQYFDMVNEISVISHLRHPNLVRHDGGTTARTPRKPPLARPPDPPPLPSSSVPARAPRSHSCLPARPLSSAPSSCRGLRCPLPCRCLGACAAEDRTAVTRGQMRRLSECWAPTRLLCPCACE